MVILTMPREVPAGSSRLRLRARPCLPGDHRVRQLADAARRDGDGVTRVEEPRRIHERAAARRGSSRQAVARLDRDDRREPLDPDRGRSDLLADERRLTPLAVDVRLDADLLPVGKLVLRDDTRAHRAERVEVLTEIGLTVVELDGTGADVVEDGVAEDVLERILASDV